VMGVNERREKAAVTDAIARELIAKEKAKRDAKTARLRAQREAANVTAPKPRKRERPLKRRYLTRQRVARKPRSLMR
jgi:hypothetical protein